VRVDRRVCTGTGGAPGVIEQAGLPALKRSRFSGFRKVFFGNFSGLFFSLKIFFISHLSLS
jgi:hypothetical protein